MDRTKPIEGFRLLALVVALTIAGACTTTSEPEPATTSELKPPENFGVVVDGKIYRGAQPRGDNMQMLRDLGVKTVLKLNTSRADEEVAAAREAGLRLIHIPFDAETIGNAETCNDVAKALEIISDESNWPIYVHCSRGRDRAGYMIGLYRLEVQGWAWPNVDGELAKFGHNENLREAYPQIVRELQGGLPTCSIALPKHTGGVE